MSPSRSLPAPNAAISSWSMSQTCKLRLLPRAHVEPKATSGCLHPKARPGPRLSVLGPGTTVPTSTGCPGLTKAHSRCSCSPAPQCSPATTESGLATHPEAVPSVHTQRLSSHSACALVVVKCFGGHPACSVDRLTSLLLRMLTASIDESLPGARPCAKPCAHSTQGSSEPISQMGSQSWRGEHRPHGSLASCKPPVPRSPQTRTGHLGAPSPTRRGCRPRFCHVGPPHPSPQPSWKGGHTAVDMLRASPSSLLGPPREEKQSSKRDGGKALGGTWWHLVALPGLRYLCDRCGPFFSPCGHVSHP